MKVSTYIPIRLFLKITISAAVLAFTHGDDSQKANQKSSIRTAISCYSKGQGSIKLYKSSVDNEVRDSLVSLVKEEHCWYIFEFSDNKNDRFKIKSAIVLPSCRELILPKCKNMWIDKKNILFIESVYKHYEKGDVLYLHKEADIASEKILINDYIEFSFLDFKDNWAKVGYNEQGIFKTAWMTPEDQCCAPWTVCPSVN